MSANKDEEELTGSHLKNYMEMMLATYMAIQEAA